MKEDIEYLVKTLEDRVAKYKQEASEAYIDRDDIDLYNQLNAYATGIELAIKEIKKLK